MNTPILSGRLVLWGLLASATVGAGVWLHHSIYAAGFEDGQREGQVDVANLKRTHAEELATQQTAAREQLDTLLSRLQTSQQHINQIAGELAQQQRQYRDTTDRLKGELSRVTTQYRRSLTAAPEPLPACVFTRDFVRLYDEATGAYPLPTTQHSTGAAASTDSANTAGELDSGLTQSQFLEHHIRYAEQCRSITAQLNGLIDAVSTKE